MKHSSVPRDVATDLTSPAPPATGGFAEGLQIDSSTRPTNFSAPHFLLPVL
jgi:hypothetical protein